MYKEHHQHQNVSSISMVDNVPNSQLQLAMALPGIIISNANAATLSLFNQLPLPCTATLSSYSICNSNVGYSSNSYMEDSKENKNIMMVNSFWSIQHPFSTNNIKSSNGSCPVAIQSHQQQLRMLGSHPLPVQQHLVQDYDENHPFFDTIDDRQSYIDSKEAYDSSSEESIMKDTRQSIEHVAENELKSAAACFSLTSVNR